MTGSMKGCSPYGMAGQALWMGRTRVHHVSTWCVAENDIAQMDGRGRSDRKVGVATLPAELQVVLHAYCLWA